MKGFVWGPVSVSGDNPANLQVGDCSLWVQRTGDEWAIATANTDGSKEPVQVTPEDLDWVRYVTREQDTLIVAPALPDRPVVVRPAVPIVLLPGRWGRFFFTVPLWIQLQSGQGHEHVTMVDIPGRALSSTWFGDSATGELCYSMDSVLTRSMDGLTPDNGQALCEVEIHNGSRENLAFARVCVHVEHMHLFQWGQHLWANKVKVVFRGADEISQLDLRGRPSEVGPDAETVGAPRQPGSRNLLKRSFNLIREITGI